MFLSAAMMLDLSFGRTEAARAIERAVETALDDGARTADIAAQGYDLSLNRYKEVVHEEVEHRAPKDILVGLAKLEEEIQAGMKELEGMIG